MSGAAQEPLRVIVFPGGVDWPICAARVKGFFACEGLEVTDPARYYGVSYHAS